MENDATIDSLDEATLLTGLSKEEIENLKAHCTEEQYAPNDAIINEADMTNSLYLIVKGEVNILKWDHEHSTQIILGRLSMGEMFGEMSFMDNSPRSTTVKAARPTTILKLSREALSEKLSEKTERQIFANIAIANIKRLRISNKIYVDELHQNKTHFQSREMHGRFLVYQYLMIGFCIMASLFFPEFQRPYVSWLLTLFPTLILIKALQMNFFNFGLNLHHWRSSALSAFLFITLIVALFYMINGYTTWSNVLTWNSVPNLDASTIPKLFFYAIYCFSQEFLGRGVMITSFQKFFNDSLGYKSTIINSFFLLFVFLPLGFEVAVPLFLISLSFGFIFVKQKTLLGIFLIHFFLMASGILKI